MREEAITSARAPSERRIALPDTAREIAAFLLLLICGLMLLRKAAMPEASVTSDLLYLEALYKDLFVRHLPIGGWTLSPAPYFFPDLPVYFVLRGLAGDLLSALYLYSLFMLSCLFFSLRAILGLCKVPSPTRSEFSATLTLGFTFLVANEAPPLFMPNIHTGVMIGALAAIPLFLSEWRAFEGEGRAVVSRRTSTPYSSSSARS